MASLSEQTQMLMDYRVQTLMKRYNELGSHPSTGFCQSQRIGIENDLKQLGYTVRYDSATDTFVAAKAGA